MKKKLGALWVILALAFTATAQEKPVQFHFTTTQISDTSALLTIDASIAPGWQLFGLTTDEADEGLHSLVQLKNQKLQQALAQPGSNLISKYDSSLSMQLSYYTDSAHWQIPVSIKDKNILVGSVDYALRKADDYPTGKEEFRLEINASVNPSNKLGQQDSLGNTTGKESLKNTGYGKIILKGFAEGLFAFLMPCIFAMLPVTVSFFLKRSKTRKEGVKNAFSYAGSIVVIFALVGLLFGLLGNPRFANEMASSAAFNIFVFAIFLIFGISFLGAFEITLPASWVNKIDSKANTKNFGGIFFMALTLVVVSFSCTAPFIGDLAFEAVKNKEIGKAVAGFSAFGLAIALPFAIGAMFPTLLSHLSKGGGWLNSLKVTLGFIELALAMKFLSSADLAYHWRLLDREVYLAIWIVLFGLLGLYLLGKLKFHHDDELKKNEYGVPYLTVTRLFFAIGALSFMVYLIPGLWGAPLKGISAWLPEMKTQDFNLTKLQTAAAPASPASASGIKPVKYTDFLESEIPGVETFFDYDEALAAAKQLKKPLMLDFTGHSCANCRKMEQTVLVDEQIKKTLQNDFVVVSLYVDDRHELPESEWVKSTIDGSVLKELGAKNLDLEVTLTNNNAQPYYVFVDGNGKLLIPEGYGYAPGIDKFKAHLEKVKEAYQKLSQ